MQACRQAGKALGAHSKKDARGLLGFVGAAGHAADLRNAAQNISERLLVPVTGGRSSHRQPTPAYTSPNRPGACHHTAPADCPGIPPPC